MNLENVSNGVSNSVWNSDTIPDSVLLSVQKTLEESGL